MKKDEIVTLLKEELAKSEAREKELLCKIDRLLEEIASLKEALLRKGESLDMQKRITKGIAKLVSNSSEKQQPEQPDPQKQKAIEEERAAKRRTRKNNGATRNMHYEMEIQEHDIYPDDPEFDLTKARFFSKNPHNCIRYECIPMRFVKHVYKIYSYT